MKLGTRLAQRIFDYISKTGAEYGELGQVLGASPTSTIQNKINTFHRFIADLKQGKIDTTKIGKLESYFHLGKGFLLEGLGESSRPEIRPAPFVKEQLVPHLGSVSAWKADWRPEEVKGWLPYPFLKNARDRIFALTVDGDCMEPILKDGEIVFIDKQFDMSNVNGRIVVVRIEGEDTTLKRLYKRERILELRPENARYAPITVTPDQEVQLIGVVVKKVGEV